MSSETQAPIVRLEGVVKSFGTTRVLDGLDLEVEAGEKVAIIGPSGSGKSTLLRILMTLEPIDAGRIVVDDVELWAGEGVRPPKSELRAVRAKVGMVFQQFNLFPHMSALENVAFAPRRVRGLPQREAEALAVEQLEQVGLGDKHDARPSQLSGGQQQRVAIARALAMQPLVMLFDEVTSALDPELVHEVLGVLRELALESNMTMLIVTHEMRFAADIADRVVFMDGGRVVEAGPPSELFEDPREERTRRFLRSSLE